ncbi:hypothetical protein ACSBR1_029565 [Camellia fascicularis]
MAISVSTSNHAIWEEIERSESYLVSCMYEEATAITSSVLRDLCHNKFIKAGEETQLNDMLESASMVLVQSLKELRRTQDILNELLLLFGSVTDIPVQVLLAGVCFQISEGPCSGTQEFLEEFLSKWRFLDERYYVLASLESNMGYMEGSGGSFLLGVDKYLEVVEVYVVTLLGMVVRDIDHAICWVEKATLPEEKRQDLLSRLHSLYSPKARVSSQGSVVALPGDKCETHSSLKQQNTSEGSPEALKASYPFKGENDMKQAILKLSQRVPCFWWFRTFTFKFGNGQLVISNGKIVLGCFMILMYYVLQRKQATLKRIFKRQALSMKKALVDLWQLAFSYQVNPLAAVQPVPTATRGTR